MASCKVDYEGAQGNHDAGADRIRYEVFFWALEAGLAAFVVLSLAGIVTPAVWLLFPAIALAAVTGGVIGFWIGNAMVWFDRLFPQNPSTITLCGCVLCARKNTGFPPWADNDWTFNLGGSSLTLLFPNDAGLDEEEIRNRAAPEAGPAFPVEDSASGEAALHCEISSHMGDYSAVGGAAGTIAGTIAGAAVSGTVCSVLGIINIIGGVFCLLIAMLIGAIAGGFAGDAAGTLIGLIADELDDFDERGEAITLGCLMNFTGRWVTDSGHQWNEIHDIESAQLVGCNDCVDDPAGTHSLPLIAAVAIGRHPTGRDP